MWSFKNSFIYRILSTKQNFYLHRMQWHSLHVNSVHVLRFSEGAAPRPFFKSQKCTLPSFESQKCALSSFESQNCTLPFLGVKNAPCFFTKVKNTPCHFSKVKNPLCPFSGLKNKLCPFPTISRSEKTRFLPKIIKCYLKSMCPRKFLLLKTTEFAPKHHFVFKWRNI